jgi:outer membrane autotransporter protein
MISYGTIIGGDSEFRKLRNGWTNVGTLYIGYNGSSIDYNDVDMTTNGGMLGVTETFYKNNFFTAITAQAGAGFAQANTMYGKDEMTSIMGGIASKTGYNFEFKEGKFVIQPNLMLNYSMVKTLDYTNAAGVRINSDPLHTIQINPTIRFIANLNHGWQPYFNVGMVWNVMNNSHVTANGVKLPNTYTKPYVEYGVGVQKHIGEKFSGYAQAMVRNGGRNGVALTAGFRWALGSKGKSEKNVEKTKSEQKISSLPNNNSGVNTTKQKTVIKSLNSTKSRNIARYMAMIQE